VLNLISATCPCQKRKGCCETKMYRAMFRHTSACTTAAVTTVTHVWLCNAQLTLQIRIQMLAAQHIHLHHNPNSFAFTSCEGGCARNKAIARRLLCFNLSTTTLLQSLWSCRTETATHKNHAVHCAKSEGSFIAYNENDSLSTEAILE